MKAQGNLARDLKGGDLPTLKQSMAVFLRRHGVSGAKVARRLNDLLDAKETKFFQHEGRVTDSREVIAWGPRAEGVRLASEMLGWRQREETGAAAGGLTLHITTVVQAAQPEAHPLELPGEIVRPAVPPSNGHGPNGDGAASR